MKMSELFTCPACSCHRIVMFEKIIQTTEIVGVDPDTWIVKKHW